MFNGKDQVHEVSRSMVHPFASWGESWREGKLNKTRVLTTALCSVLRQAQKWKRPVTLVALVLRRNTVPGSSGVPIAPSSIMKPTDEANRYEMLPPPQRGAKNSCLLIGRLVSTPA